MTGFPIITAGSETTLALRIDAPRPSVFDATCDQKLLAVSLRRSHPSEILHSPLTRTSSTVCATPNRASKLPEPIPMLSSEWRTNNNVP